MVYKTNNIFVFGKGHLQLCICLINLNLLLLGIHLPNICLYDLQKIDLFAEFFLQKWFFNQEMKVVTILSFVTATLYSIQYVHLYVQSRSESKQPAVLIHTVKYKTMLFFFFVSILALLTAILACFLHRSSCVGLF